MNFFKPSMQVLNNFYGNRQLNEFQGKETKVNVIIGRAKVMKELSDSLEDSKNALECPNKKPKQTFK